MTDERLMREVAEALEASPEVLAYMPELLADLWELGASPPVVVQLVGTQGLAGGDVRAVDLGCGKGAVAVALAKELGIRVRGVDAFAPFIEEARRRAAAAGVGHLCEFLCADLRSELAPAELYDLAVFAAEGPLLGDLAASVGQVRQAVRPGGLMVIDDAYAAADLSRSPGGAGYRDHAATLAALTAHGDQLLEEVTMPLAQLRAVNARNNAAIGARAARLKRDRPEAAPAIDAYLARQQEECRLLETELVCATWLLRRGQP